jgi:anti-sigma regulatory factor (Ser/Thr protein kinase)
LRELALHLLDIAENSVAADAHAVQVAVVEDILADRLILRVEDDGKGMDSETVAQVTDPFYTTRTTRKVGLGIPLLKEAAETCNGWLKITSAPGKGTQLLVEFQRSHIDRMPLGDLAQTFYTLAVTSPEINWSFIYQYGDDMFEFINAPFMEALGDLPITEPDVLTYLRETLETGVNTVVVPSDLLGNLTK